MTRQRLILSFGFAAACLAGYAVLAPKSVWTLLHSGWNIKPAGESVTVGDMLAGGDSSPDGKWLAFASVGQGIHRLYLLDANTGAVADEQNLPLGWIGMAWHPDGKTLYVSGGSRSAVNVFTVSDGKLRSEEALVVPVAPFKARWLAGLAYHGGHLFVADSTNDQLLKVDLESGAVAGALKLADQSSPYQVRIDAKGRGFVSLQGAGQVAQFDPQSLELKRTFATGEHPNDVQISGDRLFVACGNEDVLDVFDLISGGREERIVTRPWPDAPAGSTPHALAATKDGERLYVANSDNNAVAVVDVSRRGRSAVIGFIPTAEYPCALGLLADGRLAVGSGKGFGTGPNANTDKIDPIAPKGYPYIVTLMKGTIAVVDARDRKALEEMTDTVRSVSKYRPGVAQKPLGAPKPGTNPVPSRLGDPSPIRHVLYVIKENRTYDQLFGDLTKDGKPYGNGDPKLTLFGEDAAPNHRQLAREFVLLDNLYASGEVSVDGHHWSNGAYVPDFMQRTWPQQYSGKAGFRLSPALAKTPNDRLWDQARRKGLSYRTYYYHTTDRQNEEWAKARADGVRDYQAIDIFIKEFKEFERKGTMPRLMVMALSEDHTKGTRPGAHTPKACVASNDWALGKLVETVSRSPLWGRFAIFVIEDDAQNGPDHVDAHRTVCLVVSPYTRNAGIDSTHYTTTSVLRTIELILGLEPMSQFDASATPMYRAFRNKPDLTPYTCRKPATDLHAINPPRKESALLRAIDFSEPDRLSLAQEIELNKAIWRSVKGDEPYPGAVRRYGIGSIDED